MDGDVDDAAAAGEGFGGEPSAEAGDAAAADEFDTDLIDVAETAIFDQLLDDVGFRGLTADHADLEDFLIGVARGNDLAGEIGVEAHRLFEHDVLAGVQGVDGDGGVHVVGHADGDGFDFRILQKFLVIRVGDGNAMAFGLFSKLVRQDVAQGDEFRVGDLLVGVRVNRTDRTGTDDTDFDFSAHVLTFVV